MIGFAKKSLFEREQNIKVCANMHFNANDAYMTIHELNVTYTLQQTKKAAYIYYKWDIKHVQIQTNIYEQNINT